MSILSPSAYLAFFQNIDQMAIQSKIKYTVVEDSPYYEYFENMAYAEQVMYEAWKDIVLPTAPNDTR